VQGQELWSHTFTVPCLHGVVVNEAQEWFYPLHFNSFDFWIVVMETKYCDMFQQSAVVARQQEVQHISMDMLDSPTVLWTVGEATIVWQPTIAWMGLAIGAV
jgi:hypothetical protein